ncbi:hypothetical protein HOY82DRAFT_139051 [Tuber indicum]|nr:hypothetical protein HOY82DRAFT_139051 [Tuber indicum]
MLSPIARCHRVTRNVVTFAKTGCLHQSRGTWKTTYWCSFKMWRNLHAGQRQAITGPAEILTGGAIGVRSVIFWGVSLLYILIYFFNYFIFIFIFIFIFLFSLTLFLDLVFNHSFLLAS